jgi:hypothetical protein
MAKQRMADGPSGPPPRKKPVFSFSGAAALRRKLRDRALLPFYGETIEGRTVDAVVDQLLAVLPRAEPRILYPTVIAHLLGKRLDLAAADWFCMRVAGNVRQLTRGAWSLPLKPWTGQDALEWLPAQIVKVDWSLMGLKQRQAASLTLAVAGGSFAGGQLVKRLTTRQAAVQSFLTFGFSREMRMADPLQLFGLRCLALADPAISNAERPGVSAFEATPSMLQHNRIILRRRFRAVAQRLKEGEGCPRGFPDTHLCQNCSIGFDECYGATHLRQWVALDCPACGRKDVPCDLDRNPKVCVACDRRIKLTPKERG